jgi:hypothetical protein
MNDRSMSDEQVAEWYAFKILKEVRTFVEANGLNQHRLPKWIYNTEVRVGKINNTTLFLFGSSHEDKLVEYSEVVSDAQFVFGIPDYILPGHHPSMDIRNDPRSTRGVAVKGEPGDPGNAIIVFNSDTPIHINAGYVPYHVPILYHDLVFRWVPNDQPLVSRYIPFMIYIHDMDLFDSSRFQNMILDEMTKRIEELHDSEFGDMYESRSELRTTARTDVGESVIVLGGYDAQRRSEPIPRSIKQELEDMKTYLNSSGYLSHLIEELYEPPNMSLETKVRAYTATSRFCAMVDREASGHIKEYELVKQNRVPLAIFRPLSSGSSWMIGDDELVDVNFIKTFEFEDTALERMDDAIEWAESTLEERAEAYADHYSWR